MDQRVAFIADWLRDEWTMTELAARFGISRKTGYNWVDRYTRIASGLAERSRAPRARPGDGRRDARRGDRLASVVSAVGAQETARR